MDEKKITCIICPSSCCITVKGSGNKVESVDGSGVREGWNTLRQNIFILREILLR